MAVNVISRDHRDAKRVNKTAVFTVATLLPGEIALTDGVHTIGLIEGNIAVRRMMLVVNKAFDGTAPVVTIGVERDGSTALAFTAVDLTLEAVDTSPIANGIIPPLYFVGNSRFEADIVLGDSTVGEFMMVVEYVQLETEPGLHTRNGRPQKEAGL